MIKILKEYLPLIEIKEYNEKENFDISLDLSYL